nr:lysophospholipid acyltransferase family protein [uncultured Carboxylicivirga sp.]
MKLIASYILTFFFHLYYGLFLGIFHPIQVLAHWIFGDKGRKKVVDILNFFLVKGLYILGSKVTFKGFEKLPSDRPMIIIANHQSMYDIPPVVYGFRKHYPRFISKIELAKNLPSISYNLKHGKSALIDRSNRSQAVKEIFKVGRLTQQNKQAICIYPEGTRSKNGKLKPFKQAGIETLLRTIPDAIIVPFVINGHDRITAKGTFPMMIGQTITYTVLDPIEPKGQDIEEMVKDIHSKMKSELNQ